MKNKGFFSFIISAFFIGSLLFFSCSDDQKITDPVQEEPVDSTGNPSDTVFYNARPERFTDSPYPLSVMPDTLYVVYTNAFTEQQILTLGTLQGVLAQTKPRIYLLDEYERNGYPLWLKDLEAHYGLVVKYDLAYDFDKLLARFKNDIKGYILVPYDENYVHSAISLSGIKQAIVITTENEHYAKDAGLTMLIDADKMTFSYFMGKYGNEMYKKGLCYQNMHGVDGLMYLTDYAAFGKMFHMYNEDITADFTGVCHYLNTNSALFGWIDDKEPELVTASSKQGVFVHAANYCKNFSTLSNFGIETKQHSYINNPETVNDRHTVCFLLTDGDNLGWILKDFYTSKFNVSARGKANIGWTMGPALCELAPTVLKYYYDRASSVSGKRDYFVAGPSGVGYMNPDHYTDNNSYAAMTAEYMEKSDMYILNIIGNDFSEQYLGPYLQQSQIDGIFYYDYADYAKHAGAIQFYNEKPAISARYNLWPEVNGYESSSTLAAKLNAASRDVTSSDGYTLVAVHIWTQGAEDVLDCINKLDNNKVRVVAPDEFTALIKKNVKH